MECLETTVALQQPHWPDNVAVMKVRDELAQRPALVKAEEIDELTKQLAEVATGNGFLLQGGPCAESFHQTPQEAINLAVTLANMRRQILRATSVSVLTVPRVAGQFCKPRSSDTETIGDVTLPSFRGELINDPAFTVPARTPNPERLLRGYQHASSTLDELRRTSPDLSFVAHEALLMDYEIPLIRSTENNHEYGTSGHFLWIGDRTRDPNGAHVALFRRIKNPVGVKIGPNASPQEVVNLCEQLNPARDLGRLSLIARFGSDQIGVHLPAIMEAIQDAQHEVIWVIDPMHGNTVSTPSGKKTRHLETISDEIEQFFDICQQQSVWPGGAHLEMSGEMVTECLGGGVKNLEENYTTSCDPRLNREQAILLGEQLGKRISQQTPRI